MTVVPFPNRERARNPEGPRVLGAYARVSTSAQAERGESMDVQERRLREAAGRRGWELVFYPEPGVSAKDANRPAYQRMRADLAAGRIDGVVATKLDRFWRNLAVAVTEIDFITKSCGGDLIVLDEQFDTTSAAGRICLNVLLSTAQFVRETTAERVAEVMRARAQEGKHNGGPTPYGYRRVAKGELQVDQTEAATVRRMFELFLRTHIVRQVRLGLDASGSRTRKGYPWSSESIRRILCSPTYVGEVLFNKRDTSRGKARPRPEAEHIRVPGRFPAIVSAETFAEVQRILAERAPLAPRAQASEYLLSGLVRCQKCSGAMHGHTTWRKRSGPRVGVGVEDPGWRDELARTYRRYEVAEAHQYYRCTNRTRRGPEVCPGNGVKAGELEKAVLDTLFDLRLNPERLRALETTELAKQREQLPRLRRELARLEGRLTELGARENRVLEAFETGLYTAQDLKTRRRAVAEERERTETALAEARTALDRAQRQASDIDGMIRALRTAFDAFERLSFENRRAMLRSLIDHVVAGPAGGRIVLRANLAEIGEGLFEGESGEKDFVLGAPTRVPWGPEKEMRVEPRILVQQRMGTGSLPSCQSG